MTWADRGWRRSDGGQRREGCEVGSVEVAGARLPGAGLGHSDRKGGGGTRLGQRGAKRNLQVSVTEDRAVLTQKKCLWSIVQIKKRERDLYTTEQETIFLQLCVCLLSV